MKNLFTAAAIARAELARVAVVGGRALTDTFVARAVAGAVAVVDAEQSAAVVAATQRVALLTQT